MVVGWLCAPAPCVPNPVRAASASPMTNVRLPFIASPPRRASRLARCSSEQKLQCELNLPRWQRRLNLAEGRRTEVAIRQAEVHLVQAIEKLPPKLQGLGLRQAEVLEDGKVQLREAGGLHYIPAGAAESAQLRDTLERLGVEPFARGLGTIIGIANQVGAVAD